MGVGTAQHPAVPLFQSAVVCRSPTEEQFDVSRRRGEEWCDTGRTAPGKFLGTSIGGSCWKFRMGGTGGRLPDNARSVWAPPSAQGPADPSRRASGFELVQVQSTGVRFCLSSFCRVSSVSPVVVSSFTKGIEWKFAGLTF